MPPPHRPTPSSSMTPRPHPHPAASSSPTALDATMSASSSSARSRKKIKHCRSSLEFLDAATADDVGAPAVPSRTPPPPLPPTSTSSSNSPKRKRNKLTSSLMMLSTPTSSSLGSASVSSSNTGRWGVAAAAADTTSTAPATTPSRTKHFRGRLHQRIMLSPESQSKLDRSPNSTHPDSSPENNRKSKKGGITRQGVVSAEPLVSENFGTADTMYTPINKVHAEKKVKEQRGGLMTASPGASPGASVRQSSKKRSLQKSSLELLAGDDQIFAKKDDSKQQQSQQQKQHQSSSSDRTTPKINKARSSTGSDKQQDVGHASYSPLDYRPEAHVPRNATAKKNDNDPDDDNGKMLKSYVDQWTTITEPTDADHHRSNINSKYKSRGKKQEEEEEEKKKMKKSTVTTKEKNRLSKKNNNLVDDELIDDPSSSVVSSSEDSYHHDDCDDECGDFDAEVHSTDGPAFESNKFDGHSLGCNDGEDRLPLRQSWENNIQSSLPQTNTKAQLEVEYGKLAVLMQELEYKKQLQRSMDVNDVETNVSSSTCDSVPLPSLPGQISRNTTTGEGDAETIQKELQVEYGRLAFLNNELKRKMEMMNTTTGVMDPGNYHIGSALPQFTAPNQTNAMIAQSSSQGGQSVKESLALEYGQLAFLQHELDRKMQLQKMDSMQVDPIINNLTVRGGEKGSSFKPEQHLLSGVSSSRDDDVAFGEMVYNERMAQTADSFKDRRGDKVVNFHERHARRRRERYPLQREVMDYDDDHHGHDNEYRKVGRMQPSSGGSKRKKKRKRRVVETITRVIHEESEEEGSSSTGGRHSLNNHYHSPRKYHRGNEEYDDYYDDDDMSSGERRHKVKRSSDYRKEYHNKNLSPTTDSRVPKRGKDMMNHGHIDGGYSSSDEDDVRGRTAKRHGKKQTNPRGRPGGESSSPVKMRHKRSPIRRSQSMLESLH